MNKAKTVFSFFFICFTMQAINSFAQSKEIKITQHVPDLAFSEIFNYKSDNIKLSDFKGKLLILDFWGVYCLSCLEAFPKLDSLQMEFKNKIQIITITEIKRDSIARFFKTHKHVHLPDVPFIKNGRNLDTIFPHTGVPFQVWIDTSGTIIQTSNEFTEIDVKNILDRRIISTRQAKRNVYVHTLFDDRWKDLVEYSSVILRYKYASGLHIDEPLKGKGVSEIGSIRDLYVRAFNDSLNQKFEFYKPGKVILEVNDPNKYDTNLHGEAKFEWMEKNGYGYQLVVPEENSINLYEQMKLDLDRYFHLHSGIEKRMIECYVLKRTSSFDKLKTHGGNPKDNDLQTNYNINLHKTGDAPAIRYVINEPFYKLSIAVQNFVEYNLNMPFIDSTGYYGNVDIKLKGSTIDGNDLKLWQGELQKYDLELVKEKCLSDVIVIKDDQNN